MCCYAPDFRTGTLLLRSGVAVPWGLQPVRVQILLKAVLPLVGGIAAASGRCNNTGPRNTCPSLYTHLLSYALIKAIYWFMSTFLHGVMISWAADNVGECFFPFFSFKQCILINILLRFYWDYTGRSARGQVKVWHQATRHHLKQCRTTDAYMRHRASVS